MLASPTRRLYVDPCVLWSSPLVHPPQPHNHPCLLQTARLVPRRLAASGGSLLMRGRSIDHTYNVFAETSYRLTGGEPCSPLHGQRGTFIAISRPCTCQTDYASTSSVADCSIMPKVVIVNAFSFLTTRPCKRPRHLVLCCLSCCLASSGTWRGSSRDT
jgi:hypothetical protein